MNPLHEKEGQQPISPRGLHGALLDWLLTPSSTRHFKSCAADGCQRYFARPVDRLFVTWLDQGPAHVVAAFRTNRVCRYRDATLRTVSNLAFFDAIVAAAFAGSTVTVFSLGDSHCCLGGEYGTLLNQIWPSILEMQGWFRQSTIKKKSQRRRTSGDRKASPAAKICHHDHSDWVRSAKNQAQCPSGGEHLDESSCFNLSVISANSTDSASNRRRITAWKRQLSPALPHSRPET